MSTEVKSVSYPRPMVWKVEARVSPFVGYGYCSSHRTLDGAILEANRIKAARQYYTTRVRPL